MPRLTLNRSRLTTLLALCLLIGLITLRSWLGPEIAVNVVESGNLQQTIVATGKIKTPDRIEVGSQISGRVISVPVREGDQVVAGKLLIQLDDRELRASLKQAEAAEAQAQTRLKQMQALTQPVSEQNLRQAEANRDQAQRTYKRNESLVEKQFIGQSQLDESRRALSVAEAQWQTAQLQFQNSRPGGSDYLIAESALQQAKASREAAGARLAYSHLAAAQPGTLLSRQVEPGDMVQPGKTLMVISPAGETQVVVQIDERNLKYLQIGQKAELSADAYPEQRFSGELVFINPAIDALRGSIEIRFTVPNPPAYLRQDMTVSANLLVGEKKQVLTLPVSAIRQLNEGQPWVMRVNQGRTEKQAVKIGIRGENRVEIIEGLQAGELIVPAEEGKVTVDQRIRAKTETK